MALTDRRLIKRFASALSDGGDSPLRGTAWMTYGYLVGYLFQAAYFVILARVLLPRGLGTFAGALALASAVAPFAGCGGGNMLVMRASRKQGQIHEYLGRALVLLGGSWVVLTAAVLVLRFTVLDHDAMAPLLLPFCVSELLAGRLVDLAAQCFQAQDRLSVSGSLSVYLSGARLLTIGLFAALTQSHSPGSFALWYVGASICVAIYAAVRVRRAFGSPSFRSLQGLEIRLGLTFSLGTASKSIYGDIDKFMLSSIGSSASTGIYTAAYRIVSMAFAPVFAYCYASNVRFFRAGRGGERAVWSVARSAYPAIFIYTCAVSVLLVVTAPLLPLILGHSYHESVSALRWLAVMPIVQGGHSLFGDAMMGAGRQGARAAAQLGAALLNCGLNVWLIPVLSWKGAAIASIACELSLAIVLMLMLRSMGAATEPTNGAEAGPDVSTLET